MSSKHSMETVYRAEEMYCVSGLALNSIAVQLGISKQTVWYWNTKYGWKEKRKQVLEAYSTIRMNTILLRAKLLEKCLESLNPQDTFAAVSLETIARKDANGGRRTENGARRAEVRGKKPDKGEWGPEDVIAILNDAIRIKLDRTLDDPGQLNFVEMRDLIKVIGLVETMESRLEKARERNAPSRGGLSDEAVDEIRRKILGIPEEPSQTEDGRQGTVDGRRKKPFTGWW